MALLNIAMYFKHCFCEKNTNALPKLSGEIPRRLLPGEACAKVPRETPAYTVWNMQAGVEHRNH